MRFIDLMNELAASVRIGSVTPDETGCVTLLFDNEHEVTFMPDEENDAVCFQCEVGDASRLGFDECRTLLEASFSQTDGAAFSIQADLQKVVLWKRYGEFASLNSFEKAINDFLGQVVAWKQRLALGDFGVTEESAASSSHQYMPNLTPNFIQV